MRALYFIAGKAFFKISRDRGDWFLHEKETPHHFRCLAVDPTRNGRLYGGSFDDGLWFSDDEGDTWEPVGEGITHDRVLSVAVNTNEHVNGQAVVWAGTEPSHLFRSEDGGETWTDCTGLQSLASKPEWSFPPRPHTHHVRWIQPDIHEKNRIFVGIELGGVMQSNDYGQTWQDRKPGSQYDCHTLTMTDTAKDRIYESAGGGFAESRDGGQTWQTFNDGLDPYLYLVGIAVDSGDPDTIIVSAAKSARTAYVPDRAHTFLMHRVNNKPWKMITTGLPDPNGSSVFSLLADPDRSGVFYAVNNLGVYQSVDSGNTWSSLPLQWPDQILSERIWGLTGF